jgi:hypothetical protein
MLYYATFRTVLLFDTMQTQASLFSEYFSACPVVTVPGRTFPVQTHFIDHINKALGQGGRSNSNNSGNTVSAVSTLYFFEHHAMFNTVFTNGRHHVYIMRNCS